MSTTVRDFMVEYIEGGGESKADKSISPRPEDKNLIRNGSVSDEHRSGQNGSHVIEQGNSLNGSYPLKNGFHASTEDTSDDENSDACEEQLDHNGSLVLDKVNTSNGDLNMNGIQDLSEEDVGSENHNTNGLDIHNGEKAGAKDIPNGECEIKNKIQISKQINIANGKDETVSDLLSINDPSKVPKSVRKQEFDNLNKLVNWQNTVIFEHEQLFKRQDEIIKKQALALENTNRQNDQLKRDLEIMDLVKEEENSVAGKVSTKPSDPEPHKGFKEQLSQGLNSSEMQSKMNEINTLIERLVVSSFKPPTSVGDEIKQDSHEDIPRIDPEGESKTEDDELPLQKRKSKQSDLEDPEQLQLLTKKPKISVGVNTSLADQCSSKKSQSCTRDEFRLAYNKHLQKHPSLSIKEFNFSEQLSKEKSRLAKEHLDDIAERVLNAMSLDEYFVSEEKKENGTDVTVKPRGFHPKKELVSRFEKEEYDFENFYTHLHHPLVRESCSKTSGSKGNVQSCLRRSSDQDATDSNPSATSVETCGMFPWTFTKLIEMLKSIILLNCFFPFIVIGYIITEFLNLCISSEKNTSGSRPTNRQRKDFGVRDNKHPNGK